MIYSQFSPACLFGARAGGSPGEAAASLSARATIVLLVDMGTEKERLDYWRKYFWSANSDIFDVIEHAILVAASDCPTELRKRRDRIAEKLFSCQLARCSCCNLAGQQSPEAEEEHCFGGGEDVGVTDCVDKGRKVNSGTDEGEGGAKCVLSNYSYDEAEALTEEIEEENQIVGEVLRIKESLLNKEDESDAVLFELLRRLQLMALSVEILKATEIGKAVNGLRKHRSKHIRQLVHALIDGWKILVDEWVNATACLAESTPESENPSIVDDDGLPSPPLDEGALLATQTMELSRFFDGMDDDGNPHNSELDENRTIGRKSHMENHNTTKKQQVPHQSAISEDEDQMGKQQGTVNRQAKPQEIANRQSKSLEVFSMQRKGQELDKETRQLEASNRQKKQPGSNIVSGPERPQRTSDNKVTNDDKFQRQQELSGIDKMPFTCLRDKFKNSDAMSVRVKLEAAKRKLYEGYQQAENAKKQRTIQVMELHDLPKQGLHHRQPFLKPGNHIKHQANGWR